MKISTRTRYGIKVMMALALNYGNGLQYLRGIATKENISEKYLSQIIIPLKAAGLVNSERGAYGGYFLAREPKNITVREIFETLEGGIRIIGNGSKNGEISLITQCIDKMVWSNLQQTIEGKLGAITLQDLIDQCQRQKGEIIYNI